MAKVDYIRPVEAVHGKLAKEDQVGFAQRQNENAEGLRVKFTRLFRKRNLVDRPYTAAEVAQTTKFGAICALYHSTMKNETKVVALRAAFRTNSKGWKTFRQYVWHEAEAEYRVQQQDSEN